MSTVSTDWFNPDVIEPRIFIPDPSPWPPIDFPRFPHPEPFPLPDWPSFPPINIHPPAFPENIPLPHFPDVPNIHPPFLPDFPSLPEINIHPPVELPGDIVDFRDWLGDFHQGPGLEIGDLGDLGGRIGDDIGHAFGDIADDGFIPNVDQAGTGDWGNLNLDELFGNIEDHGFVPNVHKESDFGDLGDLGGKIGDGIGDLGGGITGGLPDNGFFDNVGDAIGKGLDSVGDALRNVGTGIGGTLAGLFGGGGVGGSGGGAGGSGGGPVEQGMNRAEAESVLQALRSDRERLSELIEMASRAVDALDEGWKGADSQRFVQQWGTQRKAIHQAEQGLEAMAKALQQQMQQQQGTSRG